MAAALSRGYATASTDTGHTGDDMVFGQGRGEGDRLRLAGHPRDDRYGEADGPQRAGTPGRQVVLRGVLGRRAPGDVRGAAIPRRLRRRRVAGPYTIASGRRSGSCGRGRPRTPRTGSHPYSTQARARHQGGGGGLRQPRWIEGRPHHRSTHLHVRSGEARLQRRRRRLVPDPTPERHQEGLRRRQEPAYLASRSTPAGPAGAKASASPRRRAGASICSSGNHRASACSATSCSTIRTGTCTRWTTIATWPTPKSGSHLPAVSRDLSAFKRRGSKLLMYAAGGWTRWCRRKTRPPTTRRSPRRWAVTTRRAISSTLHGAGHEPLRRRPRSDEFDALTALEQWVEKGVAPETLIASHSSNGKVDRTSPLCLPAGGALQGHGQHRRCVQLRLRRPRAGGAANAHVELTAVLTRGIVQRLTDACYTMWMMPCRAQR